MDFTELYTNFIRQTFADALFRLPVEEVQQEYVARLQDLFFVANAETIPDLTDAYNDIVVEAARSGVDINQIEGNEAVLSFIENRASEIEAGGSLTSITEDIAESLNSIITQVIGSGIRNSEEAFQKRFEIQRMLLDVNRSIGGEFSYEEYLEINTDVAKAYELSFGGIDSVNNKEYFALTHYLYHGIEEGRKFSNDPIAEENVEDPLPPLPSFPSFGGGGGGLPDLSGFYDSLNTSENRNVQLTDQISQLITQLASQPDTPLPQVEVPEEAPPIIQGDILQTVQQSRGLRGLDPFIGFEERGTSYLESISRRGRASTFSRRRVGLNIN